MVPMIPILAVYSALAVHGIRELLFQIPVIQNEKLKRQIITAVIGILLAHRDLAKAGTVYKR